MGYGLIDNNTLANIADAIRNKANTNANYYPRDMARAISQLKTGGSFSTPVVLSMRPYMALDEYGVYSTNNYNNTTYYSYNMMEFVRTNNLPENATILTRVDWEGVSSSPIYLFENNNQRTVGLYCENAAPESISIVDMSGMFSCYKPAYTQNPFCTDLTEIMDYAYNGCHLINGSAACGERVRYFRYAYKGCYNLTEAVCGNNVVDMTGAYLECQNIRYSAPSGPHVIKMENAYRRCYNINELYIGPLVSTISNVADSCYNLVNVTGGNNVTNGAYAFSNDNNLVSIEPMPLIENGYFMFNNCRKLSAESANNFLYRTRNLKWAYSMFNQCELITQGYLWNDYETISYMFNGCTNLVSVECENLNINQWYGLERTFQNCRNLLEPIPCPNSVNRMLGTYMDCWNLQNYIIGENVTNIYECFNNCQSLTQDVTLGENINGISKAFCNCYQIQNFAILNTNIANEWSGENTFARTNYDLRRNIVIASMVSLSAFFSRNMAGPGITWTPVVEAAEVNVNGINYATARHYYNTAINCYVYCME